MDDMKNIQWFPGHMAKTRRMIVKNLSLVDAVVEMLDARLPLASQNRDLQRLTSRKPRLVILNKADMAAAAVTAQWLQYFSKKGVLAIAVDSKSRKTVKQFVSALHELLREQREGYAAKGMAGRPIRVMILGIPNVGKSSLINCLAGAKRTQTADRAGVTRAKQWIAVNGGVELLDTPGILAPKLDDQEAALLLAYTGAIRDDILDKEALAARLLVFLHEQYPQALFERYRIPPDFSGDGHTLLEAVAKQRGMLLTGGIPHTERAAIMVLDEFRGAKLGRISLEKPPCRQAPRKEEEPQHETDFGDDSGSV